MVAALLFTTPWLVRKSSTDDLEALTLQNECGGEQLTVEVSRKFPRGEM